MTLFISKLSLKINIGCFLLASQFINAQNSERYKSEIFNDIGTISNVQYGEAVNLNNESEKLLLNIYSPKLDETKKRPLILFIHGDGFLKGDKSKGYQINYCKSFAKRGYVTSSINYRLGINKTRTDTDFAEAMFGTVQDAKAAVRFFRKYADEYGIDSNQIFILCGSAGSVAASQLAYMDQNEVLETIDQNKWGNLEGNSGNESFSSSVSGVINCWGAMIDINWINTGDVPLFSIRGNADLTVSYDGSVSYHVFKYGSKNIYERALSVEIPTKLKIFEGAGHNIGSENQNIALEEVSELLYGLLKNPTLITSSNKGTTSVLDKKQIVTTSLNGNNIELFGNFSRDISEVIIKLSSARNEKISKITDISKLNPEPNRVLPNPLPNRDIWYSVVDLRLNAGTKVEVVLNQKPSLWGWNYHFHKEICLDSQVLTIDTSHLEDWENSLYIEPANVNIKEFYYSQTVPLIAGKLKCLIQPLDESWSGMAEISYVENKERKTIKQSISYQNVNPKATKVVSTNKYENAFVNCVEYILKAQNKNPNSPMYGSLNLFYDIEAQSYRSNYWLWGAGPVIKTLLEAAKLKNIAFSKNAQQLIQTADEIGKSGLESRIMDSKHPVYGVPISRWRRDIILSDYRYQLCDATSNANFLWGCGWLTLYKGTRNPAYLDAFKLLAATTDTLIKKYGLIPEDFYYDEKKFSEHTIDESGFGTEGLSKLYGLTKEPYYKDLTDRYMKEHLKKMSREDGLWKRGWNQKTGFQTTIKMTRGLGWAMEGLLASHRANPEGQYLALAKKMAHQVLQWQAEKEYWTFITDELLEKVGFSEKGTALSSYLLYQLFNETKDKKYLYATRKALNWCIENQYNEPDRQAKGGIVGLTIHSNAGAALRPW